MKLFLLATILTLSCLCQQGQMLMISQKKAPTINVNFQGTAPTPMGSSESAGVVALTNWNNVGTAATGSGVALVNSNGTSIATTIAWTAVGVYATSAADTAGNLRMMKGYLDTDNTTPTTVTFSSLVPGIYNVYVYFDGDNNIYDRTAIFNIGATTISGTDAANTTFSGTFTQASGGSNGNYVLFSAITLTSSFTLTATPGTSLNSPRAPVNGIQIIPVY